MEDFKNEIVSILSKAVNAPSGDNCQPWKFLLNGNTLKVQLVKGLDETLYNYNEFGSFLAIGAVIENIIIETTAHNLKTRVDFLPMNKKEVIATIIFKPKQVSKDPLAEVITERHTNRKPYKIETISNGEKNELFSVLSEIENTKFHYVENLSFKRDLIKALSLNDELIFSNQYLHDMLFNIVSWTEEEYLKRNRGLFVKTMELNNDQVAAFSQMKNWTIMKKLKILGIPKLIASVNQKLYLSSSGIGLISIPSPTEKNFVAGGRAVERFWLTATKLGISLHPVSGIPYLALRVRSGETTHLSKGEVDSIIDADNEIRKVFEIGDRAVALMFRLGKGQPATARSRKFPPIIEVA